MTQRQLPHSIPWSNVRWLTALIGVVLLIFGQLQIVGSAIQVNSPLRLGDWLNNELHLGIPDINNVLVGFPILIVGAILLVVSLRGLYLLSLRSEEVSPQKPVLFKLIRSFWPWILAALAIFAILLIQLDKLQYGFYSIILWIISPLIFTIAAAVWDHRRRVDLSPHLTRNDLIWLVVLLIAGFLIGTYRLQGWPDQLMGDEGNFWTIARDIALGTLRPAIFGNGVYSFPILSSILQAGIMKLFGISLWGWRMASVLPGVITVVPLYLLARDAFSKRVAIISSIVLVTSPYFLVFTRLGYNNIQALFITVLTLYWLYNGLRRSSICLTFLAGCAAGLGFYTYFGARGTIFIAIVFIALMWLTKRLKFRQVSHSLIALVVGAILITAPYFVYGIHQDAQTMGFKTFESLFFNLFNGQQYYSDAELFKFAPVIHMGGNDLFFNPRIYLVLFSQGFIRTLLAFQKPWLISEHYIAFPLAGTIGVIFYLIGLGLILKNIKEPRNQLLIVWFLTFIIGFSALNTVPPRHTHMVALIPALALFIGLGLDACVRAFGYAHRLLKAHARLVLLPLLALVALGGLHDYFIVSLDKYHQQPDQIMSWAGLNSHGESFVYVYQDSSQKDFKPYIMDEFRKSIPYQTISYQAVLDGKPGFPPNQKTIIFYPTELATGMKLVLQAAWGTSLIQRIFYSTGGIPVLAAGMNTPFTFERDRPFLNTLLDGFSHVAFIITLSLLLLLLALVAFIPAVRFSILLPWLDKLVKWFNRPPQPEALEEASQQDILLVDVPESPPAGVPAQPPAWADQFDLSSGPPKREGWAGEIKSVNSTSGKDVYVRLHIPPLHLPWSQLSKGLEISVPPVRFPNGVLLILSVFLAFAAQLAISRQWFVASALLYFVCGVGLFLWMRRNPKWMGLFTGQVRISPRAEIIFASLLLLAIAFTRFYDLGNRVYGLEADETKWTVQSWYSTILHVDQGEFATAHYQYLPVSFWVRSFFLRVFGLNFLSARIESAFLSLLSAVFLYFLVRRLTSSPPMAWLSTLLYSFSFVELNESHQALHNTTVEIWIISGLFLLILALQERKWWQFQLAGIVLALGMLTYETYFPTPLIAAVFLIAFAIFRIAKKQDPAFLWLKRALVFLWPIMLLYLAYIQKYIESQSYHFSYLAGSSANGANLTGLVQFLLKNGGDFLKTMFTHVVWTDSLINWPGPFLNPWLLVFVVIGIFYNLLNLRRPYFIFIPLWFLANAIYAPILVGAVWPRVLYTTLGPLVIWAAMGLWTFLAALRTWFDGLKLKFAAPVFALLLLAIVFNDYHIFTSSLLDPLDRQKRRELADITAHSAASVPMILFPYESNQNDSVFDESQVLLFSVAGGRHIGLDAANYFKQVTFDQTLPTLYQDRQVGSLDLVFDKTTSNMIDERNVALQVILKCYPTAVRRTSGQFFDVYHLDSATLSEPGCYQAPPPALVSPQDGAVLTAPESPILQWDPKGVKSTGFALTVERKYSNTYWIEVEDAFAGPGWSPSSEFVNGFSGNGFLFDNWQSGAAHYSLPVGHDGQYHLWIRSYKRQQNDQVNYITVAGKQTEFASYKNPLNEWVWDDLGIYTLSKGLLPISLTRDYGKDPEYSVFIDTILVTPDLVDPPDRIQVWENVLDTGQVSSTSNQFSFSQALPPGEYRWKVRLYDGDRLIDSTGALGVASPTAVFTINSR